MADLILGFGVSLTLILWMAVFDYWPTVKEWWHER
jgi:hypothetical protein